MRKVLTLAAMLGGCAPTEVPVAVRIANADPAVTVAALDETAPVGTQAQDAADDPAIWRNPGDPAASLIVGTDKKAGLYVYGLDGRSRSFVDAGRVNNVDLRSDVSWGGRTIALVAASDRNDLARAAIALFELDPATSTLRPLGKVPAGSGEAYGLCLYRAADALYAFMVIKDGTIRQIRLSGGAAGPASEVVRTLKLATQSEGCAVDEQRGRLYAGEEGRGLWRFDARPDGPVAGTLIAPVDNKRLVADVEGVAVAPDGRGGGFLVVSSQGDNAYAVWSLGDERWLGRFRVAAGKLGSTEETDGIELQLGAFGPDYPDGLFIAQDGSNPPNAQNFKLVSWADVIAALKQQAPR
jgi:3-phytase